MRIFDAKNRRYVDVPDAPRTGKVTRVDRSGVYVTVIGSDERSPIPVLGAAGVGGVVVGDVVLLVEANDSDWIAGKDSP